MKTDFKPFIFLPALIFSSCAPVPQALNTALPSISPSKTQSPAATFTPVPTPTLVSMTPVPSGPCVNPLVPLVTGNEWVYQVTGDKNSRVFYLRVGERKDIGNINIDIELFDQKHNQNIKDLVICQDGAIDNFPLYVMNMLLADYLDGTLNTYKQRGQYVPAYPLFSQNNWKINWDSIYLVEEPAGIFDPVEGSSLLLGRSSPINVSFMTEGTFDNVAVPGGAYLQALVVENDFSMLATVIIQSITTSGTLTIHTKQWYVPFVGLVRAQVESASISIMAGQESSISIGSVLELIEFKPGN